MSSISILKHKSITSVFIAHITLHNYDIFKVYGIHQTRTWLCCPQ